MTEAIGHPLSHKRLHGVKQPVAGSMKEPVARTRQGLDTSATPSPLSEAPPVGGRFYSGSDVRAQQLAQETKSSSAS